MAYSIREQIVQEVVTTLEGITVSDGYDITIQRVHRAKIAGPKIVEFPAIVVVEGLETVGQPTEEGSPFGKWTKHLQLGLVCWIEHEDMAEAANQILANVEKALMVDQTRGSLAESTTLMTNEPFVTEDVSDPTAGITIIVDVKYRHAQNDPFSL